MTKPNWAELLPKLDEGFKHLQHFYGSIPLAVVKGFDDDIQATLDALELRPMGASGPVVLTYNLPRRLCAEIVMELWTLSTAPTTSVEGVTALDRTISYLCSYAGFSSRELGLTG